MKKLIVLFSLNCLILAGCQTPNSTNSTSITPNQNNSSNTASPTGNPNNTAVGSDSASVNTNLLTKQQFQAFLQCKVALETNSEIKANLQKNIDFINNVPDGQWPILAESYTKAYQEYPGNSCK